MSPAEEEQPKKRQKGTVVRRGSGPAKPRPSAASEVPDKAATKSRPATKSGKSTPKAKSATGPKSATEAPNKSAAKSLEAPEPNKPAPKPKPSPKHKPKPVAKSTAKSAGKQPAKRPVKTNQAAKRAKPRAAAQVPDPTLATYFSRFEGGRPAAAAAGLLAIAGVVLLVVADYLPYIQLADKTVSAPVSVWSVLAHVIVLALALVAGGALLAGRGGRTALAALVPVLALAPGTFLIAWYDGSFKLSHPGLEYYFGTAYDTSIVSGEIGRTLVMVGCGALVLAAIAVLVAWRSVTDLDLIPLEGARRFPAGAAVISALLAIGALAVPSGVPAVQKYKDPSGFVLSRDIETPTSVITSADLALAGGIVLIVGWLVAGAFAGSRITRTAMVSGLVGLAATAAYSALLNLRDVTAGADVVGGPRLYLYAAAAVLSGAAAVYAATARRAGTDAAANPVEED